MAGRTVLVTGATGGIGKATALGLALMGARVGITGRDPARAKAAASALLRGPGGDCPSLYKHVGGIHYLQQRIAVRAKNELADVLARAAVGRSRDDAIVSISEEYRRWVLDHRRTSTTRQ